MPLEKIISRVPAHVIFENIVNASIQVSLNSVKSFDEEINLESLKLINVAIDQRISSLLGGSTKMSYLLMDNVKWFNGMIWRGPITIKNRKAKIEIMNSNIELLYSVRDNFLECTADEVSQKYIYLTRSCCRRHN